MQTKTKPNKNKVMSTKADYSHVGSRLFSYSKSKEKSPKCYQKFMHKTVRQSLQKVELIGQQKYKQAMRHVERFNKYQEERLVKKKCQNQKIDQQCTFRPKLNKNKMYADLTQKFMTVSSVAIKQSNNSVTNPQKIDLKINSSTQKKQKVKEPERNIKKSFTKKPNPFLTVERLMKWGRQRDSILLNKTVQMQLDKSLPKGSVEWNKSVNKKQMSKLTSSIKLDMKKSNLTQSNANNQCRYGNRDKSMDYSQVTLKTGRIDSLHNRGRQPNSFNYNNSNMMTPREKTTQFDLQVEQSQIQDVQLNRKKVKILHTGMKSHTEINPSLSESLTIGEKVLPSNFNRGEDSFYKRKAKANTMKNYQKTQLLIRDKQYSQTFHKLTTKATIQDKFN